MKITQRTIIQTKNNSFGINGKVVDVIEMVGNRVSCKVFVDELQKFVTADFHKDECVFI